MIPLALVGPTSSGKTALSIPLAQRLDGEIISVDSRQVYRGMDIGTDKVAPEARAAVPHHGLDVADPGERYSAGRFAREARRWIADIEGRGRLPILVGGTGFFLRALTDPVFREPPLDPVRRERLRERLAALPAESLERWVRRLDSERASLAIEGGRQRILRTLEVALLTGRPLSRWHREATPEAAPLVVRTVLLVLPPEELRRRIEERAESMFARGLLDEVARILESGVPLSAPSMTGTGYREAAAVLAGERTVEEAVSEVQRVTRAYARRQRTWFRNQLIGPVLELDASAPVEVQVERVASWWEGTGGGGEG